MKRFQDALEGHLNKQLEKVNLEVRELKEGLKDKLKEREEIGVNLYGVQQELAKFQMTLEKNHDECAKLSKLRNQAEEQLNDVRNMYKQTQQNVNQQQKEGRVSFRSQPCHEYAIMNLSHYTVLQNIISNVYTK